MAGGLEAAVDRLAARWVATVDRRPGLVLVAALCVTVAAGVYAATHLGINADPRTLVNPDLPFQVRQREFARRFHSLSDGILVVIDAESPTQAGHAADQLAAALEKRTDLFGEVDVPGGGDFFAQNALLYLDREQLEDLTDRLSQVQPFLGELARDQSLVAVADLLREALDAEREGRGAGIEIGATLDRVSAVLEDVAAGRTPRDPWGAAIMGSALPPEARQRIVAVRPLADAGEYRPGAPELVAIRQAVADLDVWPREGLRVRISGEPVMNGEELIAVATQTWRVAILSTLLFAAVVIFALRSTRTVVALVGSLLVSLVCSNGVAALLVRDLNVISAAFNVLIVGLGGEFGIHFAMRYLELGAAGRTRTQALVGTAESIGGSLLSSAVTTSIGFFVFLLTDFSGVAQLGVISGVGMFVSLASTVTVLPALLAVGGGQPPATAPAMPPWLARLDRLPLRFAAVIRPLAVVLALGAILLLPRIRFDYNPVSLHDPHADSVSAFQELLARGDASPWTVDAAAPSLDAAQALAARLARLPTVAEARTLVDYVPSEQAEKLEIIETAAYFVPERLAAGPRHEPREKRAALAHLHAAAARAADGIGAPAERLAAALDRVLAADDPAILERLEPALVGSLPEQIRDLQRLLRPARVTLEDLPASLRRQMLAPDGSARVQALPREDISDGRALERFVADVHAVVPEASGLAAYTVSWSRVTWRAMLWALGVGVGAMMLFLVVLWRSVWDMLLAFFPLALAAILTCASLVLLGEPFNFANVIVLPMLIGMSVDSGVHLVHRHRSEPDEADVLTTSTARAVFYSALTTMLSFGSLAFAPHRGIASIGELLTIGVGLVLVCYVVVLPAVLEWDDRRRRPAEPMRLSA